MNGIRVGNLFGIPFFVNPSWFFVLGLVTLSYGQQLASFPQLEGITPLLLGFVTALLLFASVVAHELGHSLVAISQGIEVKSITLFLFGGLATLEKESETPFQAFLVAIAGPVVSAILFGLLTFFNLSIALPLPLKAIVSLIAYLNLVLAIFNLIPGLPLDGGNIVKAIVWQWTGNPNKGVIFASKAGQFFGWTAIIIGALGIIGISNLGNFWTLLIGWFLLQNAGLSGQAAKIQEVLSNYKAADAVIPNSPIVSGNLTLREFVNNYVIGKKEWDRFLITNHQGQLLGTIKVDDLKKVPTSQWTETYLRELMQSVDSVKTIQSDLSLLEAIKLLESQKIKELTVIGENGFVIGLLEKDSIIKLLQQKELVSPA